MVHFHQFYHGCYDAPSRLLVYLLGLAISMMYPMDIWLHLLHLQYSEPTMHHKKVNCHYVKLRWPLMPWSTAKILPTNCPMPAPCIRSYVVDCWCAASLLMVLDLCSSSFSPITVIKNLPLLEGLVWIRLCLKKLVIVFVLFQFVFHITVNSQAK